MLIHNGFQKLSELRTGCALTSHSHQERRTVHLNRTPAVTGSMLQHVCIGCCLYNTLHAWGPSFPMHHFDTCWLMDDSKCRQSPPREFHSISSNIHRVSTKNLVSRSERYLPVRKEREQQAIADFLSDVLSPEPAGVLVIPSIFALLLALRWSVEGICAHCPFRQTQGL